MRARAGVNCLEGVGMIEAPRGVLIHHYKVDEQGAMQWANLIVATGHNNLAINHGVQAGGAALRGRRAFQGRHAQPRLGGGAGLRPVPELLDARRRHAGDGDRPERPGRHSA